MKKVYQSPKGFRDILPVEQPYWQKIRQVVQEVAAAYGFSRIDLPFLEETELFERGVGQITDIVEKQMFNLRTRGGDNLTLRPEATASVCRAYIEHGMKQWPQPVKLYYCGPMFRYEQPQSGRLRQFWQFGAEILGDTSPVLDAQLCQIAFSIFSKLKIQKGISIHINCIGCEQCRPEYRRALVSYLRARQAGLCTDCKRRLRQNPLRVLDCKEDKCQPIKKEAPQIVDFLCNACNSHFKAVLEYLDVLSLPYLLNTHLVRGLDYYTKTVLEFIPDGDAGSQGTLCAGGRYDGLISLLGGRPTPAVGWSLGMDRVVEYLKKQKISFNDKMAPQVFLVQIGDLGRKKSLVLFEKLKQSGLRVAEAFSKDSLKSQFKAADQLSAPYAIILGQKEAIDEVLILRDMQSGIQENIKIDKIVDVLKKRLKERN